LKFYRNHEIEEIAEARLRELEKELGKPLSPPIPIDILAEKVLGLDFLWDSIEELPGEQILGGLIPKRRLIVLNEKYQKLFNEKPGLEYFTKGHEMGHWDLFIDKSSLDNPSLFTGGDECAFARRRSNSGDIDIIKKLQGDPDGRELLRKFNERADDPDEARSVNRYSAALSMPKQLIREEALKIDRTHWPNLYQLAEKFNVTISALKVRLMQLKLLHIDESGKLHDSPDAVTGQGKLSF
jgi:hypothetical protein